MADEDDAPDYEGDLQTHIDIVRDAQPNGADRTVYRHIIIDHLGKTLEISEDDFPSFRNAYNHSLVRAQEAEFKVNWDNPALGEVAQVVKDLTGFVRELPDGVADQMGIDLTNVGFWKKYIR